MSMFHAMNNHRIDSASSLMNFDILALLFWLDDQQSLLLKCAHRVKRINPSQCLFDNEEEETGRNEWMITFSLFRNLMDPSLNKSNVLSRRGAKLLVQRGKRKNNIRMRRRVEKVSDVRRERAFC